MLYGSYRLTLPLIVAAALFPGAVLVRSQDSQNQAPQSVADAARQSREQKNSAAKPSKVITDDDLDREPPGLGVNVGSPPKLEDQPPSPQAVAAAEQADKAPEIQIEQEKKVNPEVARLKEQILPVQKELDLLQREFALDQDAYYSNPNYTEDTAGKQKLDSEQQQITEKQQQLEQLKAQLEALLQEEKASKPSTSENNQQTGDKGSAPTSTEPTDQDTNTPTPPPSL